MATEAEEIESTHIRISAGWQQTYDREVPLAQRAALGERVTPEYYSKERLRERYPEGMATPFAILGHSVIQRSMMVKFESPVTPQVLVESTVERALALMELHISEDLLELDYIAEVTRVESSNNTRDAGARSDLARMVHAQPYRRASLLIQTLRSQVPHVKGVATGSMRKWPGYVGPLTVFAD